MPDVDSHTLWDRLQVLSSCFSVAIKALHQHLMKKHVLRADETRSPVLGVADRPTINWFDWVLVGEDAVLHSILDSRSNEAVNRILTRFKGTLLTDRFAAYESRAKALHFKNANDWPPRRYVQGPRDGARGGPRDRGRHRKAVPDRARGRESWRTARKR